MNNENIQTLLEEISSFYVNPAKAINLLEKSRYAQHWHGAWFLLETEKHAFLKRVSLGILRLKSIEILEATLSSVPAAEPIPGYTLGLAAYQAEMEYHGGPRFTGGND